MVDYKTTCAICNKKYVLVGNHINYHNISPKKYYDKYIKVETEGKCKNCGKLVPFYSIPYGYPKFCSCKCAQSHKDTKRKQRKAHLGLSRPDMYGKNNPAKSKKAKAKISKALRGNKHTLGRKMTKEQLEAHRLQVTKQWASDPDRKLNLVKRLASNINVNYKYGRIFSIKLDKEIYYRSSYELRAIEILEKDRCVAYYKLEPGAIRYRIKGKIKHYIPDYLVTTIDGRKHIVEIKPNHTINDPGNKAKFKYARKFASKKGWTFRVWTEDKLFK